MGRVIDSDSHLFETADMWRAYADPGDRGLALKLEDDELGHRWVVLGDRRLDIAHRHTPGDTAAMGEYMRAVREGKPASVSFDEATPDEYWDPDARLAQLDRMGIDATVLFPNWGLTWERHVGDVATVHANLVAWNRWAGEVAARAPDRLYPVGHLALHDLEWAIEQLSLLRASDIKLAMIPPGLINGKRMSHPDNDRLWSAFVGHGITPVFHVGAFPRPFAEPWYDDDPDEVNPVLDSVFLHAPAALALADMAVHGTFDRHPGLRLGVMELSAVWLPLFLLNLDGGFDFHARFNGEPLTRLAHRPSEYITRQVRVAAFAYEGPDRLQRRAGDVFMFCSDYPHAEGTATALEDYRSMCDLEPTGSPGLFGDNVQWLLREA